MLSEALKYLTTPCAAQFKSMGYLKELIALEARYKRCRLAWEPHLEQTKAFIREALNKTSGHKRVVVLGAGILSDIPIEALSNHFETVELVDVCFLSATKRKAQKHRNIKWHSSDITGLACELSRTAKIPPQMAPDNRSIQDADLVISANILSQLPLTPIAYLQRKSPQIDDAKLDAFAHDIIKAHIELLRSCSGAVCLITETERQFIDGDQVLKTEDPLFGYKLQSDDNGWLWELAPIGEASPDYAIRNRVGGEYWNNDSED